MESDPRAGSPRPLVRRLVAAGLATVVALLLVYSAWREVPHSWRLMRSQHATFAGYTRAQRDRAFGALIPMPMEIFDFWRPWLSPWDRYFIQMPPEAFSTNADKRYVARNIAHLYLLPAIEATSLADATTVLSWDADPGTLHLQFWSQQRAGQQLIFVSRIKRGS